MIRSLRLSDIPGQFLPGRLASTDMAATRATLQAQAGRLSQWELARWAAPGAPRRAAIGAFDAGALQALALIRTRRSPTVWEIARLFCSAHGYAELEELMAACVGEARRRGADRLFLQTPQAGGARGAAERTGFLRAFTREVFAGALRPVPGQELRLRRLRPGDEHALFRLHTASAPPVARAAMGVTLEQWAAAREPAARRAKEFVWDDGHRLAGWLRLDHSRGATLWMPRSILITRRRPESS